jgi:hypothetical protein
MTLDWQALIACAIVLVAAAYLARRWWPGLRALWQPASENAASTAACHSTSKGRDNDSCGSGCGQCSTRTTPSKDHRVHIVKPQRG